MKSLYESILGSNSAGIENVIKDWLYSVDRYGIYKDCKIDLEEYRGGFNVIFDSFEHQPQLGTLSLDRDAKDMPSAIRGIYYMKYESRSSKGVRIPFIIRIANVKDNSKLDWSNYYFCDTSNQKWWNDIFQIFNCNISTIEGLPNPDEDLFYKISQSKIGEMKRIKSPNISLEIQDGTIIDPFNITGCEFKRLIISDLIMGSGWTHISNEKGISNLFVDEYARHGNIYELCEYDKEIVKHLLERNKIDLLQIWCDPSNKGKNSQYCVFKSPKYGYCIRI